MGGPPSPRLDGSMAKLFGENTAFSATLEFQTTGAAPEQSMTMPGKIYFDEGKSRFEMDMSQMKGGHMSPQAAAQMKSMGMDKMINITRPDKKVHYLVYDGLQSYLENPLGEPGATATGGNDAKVETTELGKETIDGHPCVKNKVVVTDKDGKKFEATVWNATDLKKFPVKVEFTTEQGATTSMLYKDISLSKPDASLFEPPANFTKSENMMEMMMKHGGMGGGFPGRPPRQQ